MQPSRTALGPAAIAAWLAAACSGGSPAPGAATGASLSVAVVPLQLRDVGDACYDLRVVDGDGLLVWARGNPAEATRTGRKEDADDDADVVAARGVGAVCASQFSATHDSAGGDVTVHGVCNAKAAHHTLTVWVHNLYGVDGKELGDNQWDNPCAPRGSRSADPLRWSGGCDVSFDCRDDAETSVALDLVIARRSAPGFFDTAVDFTDVFCSAKVECSREGQTGESPLYLVASPETGELVPSVSVAFACASEAGADTQLYLTGLALECGDAHLPLPVATDAVGAVYTDASGENPSPSPLLQLATYRGFETVSGDDGEELGKLYFNAALAVDFARLAVPCRLTGLLTASDGPFSPDFETPAGTVYPTIRVELELTEPGASSYVCTRHPLGMSPADGIWLEATSAQTPATFDFRVSRNGNRAAVTERERASTITLGDAISFSRVKADGVTISWGQATDDGTHPAGMRYKLVRAASAGAIDTVAEADAVSGDDRLMNWTTAVTTFDVTGLTPATPYTFAVVTEDAAGKKALYAPATVTTARGDDPLENPLTVGAAIHFSDVTTTSVAVAWGPATSTVAAEKNIQYKLVMAGDATAIDTLAEVDAIEATTRDGAAPMRVFDWAGGTLRYDVEALDPRETVAFAVLTRDGAGNVALYAPQVVTTLDVPDADPGPEEVADVADGTAAELNDATVSDLVATVAEVVDEPTSPTMPADDVAAPDDTVAVDIGPTTTPTSETDTVVADTTSADDPTAANDTTPADDTSPADDTTPADDPTTATISDTIPTATNTSGDTGSLDPELPADGAFLDPNDAEVPPDLTPPMTGAPLALQDLGPNSASLTWGAATDDTTPARDLRYKLVRAASADELATAVLAATVPAEDVIVDWSLEVTAADVTGLDSSTRYAFAVLVTDLAGNLALYGPIEVMTDDVTAPVPGDPLTFTGVAPTSLQVDWGAASDDVTLPAALRYQLVSAPSPADIDSLAAIAALGDGAVVVDFTAALTSTPVSELVPETTYAFAVVVLDAAGNAALYAPRVVTTAAQAPPPDTTPPRVGSGPVFSNVGATELSLDWGAASDDRTAAGALEYKVVRAATAAQIATVALADAVSAADVVVDWSVGPTHADVSGLASSTRYAFNVLVRDAAGLEAAYTAASVTTLDVTTPVAGSAIVVSNVAPHGLTLTWGAGSDDLTVAASLQYKVVKAASAEALATLDDALRASASDVVADWTDALTTVNVTGLASSTTYAFVVLVRDAAHNMALYSAVTAATPDVTAPVVGSGLTFASVQPTSMTVTWGAASDDVTLAADLEYKLVKRPTTAEIDTIAEANAITGNDLLLDWSANITTQAVTGLTGSTTYAFAVLVRDASNNLAIYIPQIQATPSATPPKPGTALSFASVTATSMTVSWGAATDPNTPTGQLQYRLVKALATTSIDTIAKVNAITGSDVLVDWGTNTLTKSVTGLDSAVSYAFAVAVRDAVGNVGLYAPKTQATLDNIAPVAGADITFADVAGTSMTVKWGAASDNATAAAGLQYKLVKSLNYASIDTLAEADAVTSTNGDPAVSLNWTAATLSKAVSSLGSSKTYAFAVIVRDASGNKAFYKPQTQMTLDVTAPVVGAAISFSDVTPNSMIATWGAASDNLTAAANLKYKLVKSTSAASIATVAQVDAVTGGDVLIDWELDVTSMFLTNLSSSTNYALAVLVKDEAGNKSLYSPKSQLTTDITPPTPGAAISFSAVMPTSMTVTWGPATDDVTLPAGLKYKLVRSTDTTNIDTLEEAAAVTAPDLILDWTTGATSKTVTGLTSSTVYAFAVLVKDASGNVALYAPKAQMSADATPPVAGSAITFSNVTGTTLTASWGAASDNITQPASLEYKIVRASNAASIDTISEVDALTATTGDPLVVQTWTANVTTKSVTALLSSHSYAVAVLVRDAAGNKALYAPQMVMTLDLTAPVPGAAIAFNTVTPTSMNVTWGPSTDDVTSQVNLQYKLVRASVASAIDTIAEADAVTGANRLVDWTTATTSFAATGLTSSTTYAYTVLVRDAAGNKAQYAVKTQMTTDVTAPTVGNGPTFASVTGTSMSVSWTAASDDTTAAATLMYKLVKKLSADAIDTLAEADAVTGADVVCDWTANRLTQSVTGLTSSTAYAFAVLVKDAAGNKSLYAPKTQVTSDMTPPTVAGVISFSSVQPTSLWVNWDTATDDISAATTLKYKLVKKLDPTLINTVAKADAVTGVDLVMDWTVNTNARAVTGLVSSTTYAFAVLVKDEAGNKAIYLPKTQMTVDVTAPVAGAAISFANVASNAMTVQWGSGTDDVTSVANLQYKLVKRTLVSDIDTIAEVDAISGADLVMNWTAATTLVQVTGLTSSRTYYFAVLVRDAAGNMTLYAPRGQLTSDVTPPAIGTGISFSDVGTSTLSAHWGAATDDVTLQQNLLYKVVIATDPAEIDTVSAIDFILFGDPRLLVDFTADLQLANANGLASGTTYWVAVVVMDAAGNEALYGPAAVTTL